MNWVILENILRQIGLAGTIFVLAVIFWGIWKGMKHPLQPGKGLAQKLLRSILFFVVTSVLYFGLCYLLWIPLPIPPSIPKPITLLLGSILFFCGLGLILWGRLTLGSLYNVSTSQGAALYLDHQLITKGPFAFVRHPMYLGILLTGLGGILLYRTWTMVFFAANFLGLLVRARREEEALARQFGQEWLTYCQRVPAFFPRILKKSTSVSSK
jgi:protein-S-isoprenylcysteine O-methyltransferase Ste14